MMESGARESNDQSAAPAAPSSRAVQFDLDRTISLSDGIFAFALTLLVLSITVPLFPAAAEPTSGQVAAALTTQIPEFISYIISFAVIGGFWIRHHRFCGSLDRVDGRFLVINLAYMATIAFIPFPTHLIGRYGDTTSFSLYAAVLGLSILIAALLAEHAARTGLFSVVEKPQQARWRRFNSLTPAAIFLLSIPVVAVTAPEIWPGYIFWGLLWPTGVLFNRFSAKAASGHSVS